jgi:hypothetical protein
LDIVDNIWPAYSSSGRISGKNAHNGLMKIHGCLEGTRLEGVLLGNVLLSHMRCVVEEGLCCMSCPVLIIFRVVETRYVEMQKVRIVSDGCELDTSHRWVSLPLVF